ncbi:hypothetical protein QBZ16_002667 [Prototheca wickerhamii]|uniref:Transcription factor IIIC subunit 5 HTH domain-containing protein n=1 Tax=Prototheca wickerhamii TaxID=3111 RepID=A0AAD9MIW3_PROWI|nr:hypothetical protein QBZ16_002667 [Prototheca wickerhamii]
MPAAPEGGLSTAVERLEALFRQKPVWVPTSLLCQANAVSAQDVSAALPRLAYKFKRGPWKGAWVLRGYDPRREPAARGLQTLQYQLPQDWCGAGYV